MQSIASVNQMQQYGIYILHTYTKSDVDIYKKGN